MISALQNYFSRDQKLYFSVWSVECFWLPKFQCVTKKVKVKQIISDVYVAYKNVLRNHTQLILKAVSEDALWTASYHPIPRANGLMLASRIPWFMVKNRFSSCLHSAKFEATPNRLCRHTQTQQIPPIVMSPPPSHLVDWREDYYLHMKATSFHWHVKVN